MYERPGSFSLISGESVLILLEFIDIKFYPGRIYSEFKEFIVIWRVHIIDRSSFGFDAESFIGFGA